jgi:hypothetical protein
MTTLLTNARIVRQQLQSSARWSGKTSIRDAVELAADNLRQLADEALADAIEEGAAPCDGGPTPGGCH